MSCLLGRFHRNVLNIKLRFPYLAQVNGIALRWNNLFSQFLILSVHSFAMTKKVH